MSHISLLCHDIYYLHLRWYFISGTKRAGKINGVSGIPGNKLIENAFSEKRSSVFSLPLSTTLYSPSQPPCISIMYSF